MTGQDILAARNQFKGDFVVVPRVAFKSDELIMLDGVKLEDLERQLGLPIRVFDFDGFAQTLVS